MANEFALAGEGALWVQLDGPNSEPHYLGCHNLGDIDEPVGDLTLVYCPNPDKPNDFIVAGSYQGSPGPVTTSLETDVNKTRDYLEQLKCPTSLYVHNVRCGKKNVFGNWDRSFLLKNVYVTSRGLSKLAVKDPTDQDRAVQSFEISAESLSRFFQYTASQVALSGEAEDLTCITTGGQDRCASGCGAAQSQGDLVFLGSSTLAASAANTADVWKSSNGGASFSLGQNDPFAGGEKIAAIATFVVDRTITRVMVVRGTTDVGNPLEIAYSDNNCATWTQVNVGSTNGQYAFGPQALFVLDYYNIWLVAGLGYIYFSGDGGATWTTQSAGTVTVQQMYAVHFADENFGYAVGANNAILRTIDGGITWSLVTGPTAQAAVTINSVWNFDRYKIWLGYNDGELWYSWDGGVNWSQRSFSGSGAGKVWAVRFYDAWTGILLHENALGVGTILITINGGYSWEALTTPTNLGLVDAVFVSPTTAWVVGDASGGSGMLIKVAAG